MKKRTIILIVILAILAILAALICVGLVKSAEAHDAVYADYAAAVSAVNDAALTVTEGGSAVGTYSLADLGVRDATLAAASAPYSAVDRMDADAFSRCSIQTRLEYLRATRPEPQPVTVVTDGFDASEVLSDLHAKRRTPSTDAHVEFKGGEYQIIPETQGTEIDDAAVTAALLAALSPESLPDLCRASAGADAAVVPLTALEIDEKLYIKPAITVNTVEYDPPALLAADLSGQTLDVHIGEQTRGLSETALSQLLSASPDGKLSVDSDALSAIIDKWSEDCDQHYVDYVFSAYSGKKVPISFIKVDYTVDRPALLEALSAQLLALNFSDLDSPINCTRNGENFDISGTYVEVDIDNQTMTMYKDSKCIVHTSVVTGALDGHQTPTGFYHVENKDTDCWLSGPDYLVFVKYWVGIYGPYGLHDSSWRENYGSDYYVNGGSHGCVNTPESAMKTIFDNINVGDPVLVFGKNQWYDTTKN